MLGGVEQIANSIDKKLKKSKEKLKKKKTPTQVRIYTSINNSQSQRTVHGSRAGFRQSLVEWIDRLLLKRMTWI